MAGKIGTAAQEPAAIKAQYVYYLHWRGRVGSSRFSSVSIVSVGRNTAAHPSAFPDPARVVLAARDHSVALVIKRARKNFVNVPFENLEALAGLNAPHAAGLVARRGYDAVALGVELNLRRM